MTSVPSRHLWVGGLPEEIGEAGIKDLFSKYGKIEGVKILPQRYPNLGVAAFIDFYDVRSAIDAKEAKIVFQGCELRTNFKAKPTEKFEHPTRKEAPASAKRQESPEKETKDKEKARGNESSSSSSSGSGSSSDSSSSNDSSSESEKGKKKKKSKGDVDSVFLKVSNLATRPERILQDGLYYEFTRYSPNAVIRMYGDGMDVWAVVKFESKENCKKAYVEAQGLVLFGSKIKLTPINREDFPVGGRDIQVVPPGPASGGIPPMAHIGGVPMPKPFPAEDIDPQATRSLFVGNIPKNISVYELRDIFQRFGDVLDVEIKKMSGNATYGFVLFYDLLSAVSAKQFMDGENIRGNNIRVGFGKGTPSKMLWVDGVDPNMLESNLERTMSKYGKVVRLGVDRQRCSAMVQFDSMEAAKDALNGIKGTFIGNSRRIMTDYANRDARAAFFSRMESGEPVGPPRFPGPGMYGPAGMGPGPRGMMMPRPGMPMMGMSRGGFPPMHGPPMDLYYYNPFMGEGMGFYGQPPFPGGPPMRGVRRFSHGPGPYEDNYDDYGDELRAFTRKREKEKEEKKRKERRRKHSSSEESEESDSGDSTTRRRKKASKDKDKQKKAKKEKNKEEKGSKDPESDASSDGEMSKKEEARLRATQRSRDLREKLKKRGRKKEKEAASSDGEALTDQSDSEKEVELKKSSKRLKEKKDQEKDKERDREKDREKERDKERDREKDRDKERDREKEREREGEKEKGRDREREREKEKEKEREKEREKDRERDRQKETDRERDREKEKERDKDRERDREKDREKDRDTEKEKEREKARERTKGRDKDKERERGREKEREEDREKSKNRDKEMEREKVKEKERDRRRDKEREEGKEAGRGREKQRDRSKPAKDELKEREQGEKNGVKLKSPSSPPVPMQEEVSEPPKITLSPRTPPSPEGMQIVGDAAEPEQPRAQVEEERVSPALQRVPSTDDKGGEDAEKQGGVPETPESPPHKRTLQQKLESDLSSGEEFPEQVLGSPSLPQEEEEKERESSDRKSSKDKDRARIEKEFSPQPRTPPTEPSSAVPSPPTVSSSPLAAVQRSPHLSEEESEERGNGADGSRKSKKLPRCYQIEDEKQRERQREVREHRHPSKPHPPTTPSPPPAYVGHRRRPLHSPPPPDYSERRWRHRGRPFSPGQFMPRRYSRSPPPGYPPSPPSHGGGRSPYSGSPPPRPRTPIQRPRDRGGPRHRYESPPYDSSRAKHPRRGSSPIRHPSPSPPPRPRSPGRRHPRRYSRSPSPARRSPLRRKERSLSPGSSRSSPRHVEDRLESRKHGKKPQVSAYSRSPSPKPKRREGPREDYPDAKRRRVDETRPKSPPGIPPLPKEEPKLLRSDKSQPPSYQSPVTSFSSGDRHPPHHTGKESSRYPPQPQPAPTHPSVPARSHYTQPSPKHPPVPVPAPVAPAVPQVQQQQQQPPQPQQPTDNLMDLLRRYPVMWQGHLTLKNDSAAVQLHFLSGNVNLAKMSLPQTVENRTPALRIAQRMRLEQTQLEGVERRMQSETEHCLLLALPCGRDANDVRTQTHALKNSLISYLLQKQAAGIINVPGSQTGFVLHIFPPCSFSQAHLSRVAPDLLSSASDNCHLMIIVATM